MSFFFLFFSCKIREQGCGTGPVWGVATYGRGEKVGKVCRRVNIVVICLYMYVNRKMISVETIPGMWEGETKENVGGG
jgi:hypothetical protein